MRSIHGLAIALERVKSRPSTKYKHPVGKDEITLKKGDTVRYLLANAEWEGGSVVTGPKICFCTVKSCIF